MNHFDFVRSCEQDFVTHGDSHLGAGWARAEDNALLRYDVVLALMEGDSAFSLLDFGCGTARLLDHALSRGLTGMEYAGLDLSTQVLDAARAKHPDRTFWNLDVLVDDSALPEYDYVVLNGVFQWKGSATQEEMIHYFERLLTTLAAHATKGMAFNVMSPHVDLERDDLFHLPLETATDLVAHQLSRRFRLLHDYGQHEYTVHVLL